MKSSPRDIQVTLIGSFKKDEIKLRNIYTSLSKQFNLLSPKSIDFTDDDNGFVKTRDESELSVADIENSHLDAIAQSDFVVLHAPDGYVGSSGSLEVGFAYALGIPIIADEAPTDVTISAMITSVENDLVSTSVPLADPGRGLNALQHYYDRTSKRRGWDKESPRDTMLLLTEEIGELARAIRKHEGLKRATGYDGVSLGEEIADVQLYLVHLANTLNIELSKAVTDKEAKNALKHGN